MRCRSRFGLRRVRANRARRGLALWWAGYMHRTTAVGIRVSRAGGEFAVAAMSE